MARPKVKIDWEKVDEYLRAHCGGAAVARLLGIHPETLYRRCEVEHKVGFTEYSAQKKEEGKELLRNKQFSAALSGNTTMMIWLGKQYLGQADKVESTVTNKEFEVEIGGSTDTTKEAETSAQYLN